ncbi:MAG: DUF3084 domain-containing protein [Synergistetes bacterium]|nr:DUF3084 domain-containing protein [Synergistota bacterium]
MDFFRELNWPLLLVIVLLSAIIAFIGDRVGWKLGRKRLTLWGLRPRHTTSLIAVFTGLMVALVTMLLLSFTVPSVHRALLGIKSLQHEMKILSAMLKEKSEELKKKTEKVKELEARISELKELARRLNLSISAIRGRTIIYRAGELVYQKVIKVRKEDSYLKKEMEKIFSEADLVAKGRGAEPPFEGMRCVLAHPEDIKKAILKLRRIDGEAVVRLIAGGNIVVGEWVPIRIKVYPNKLVFKKGERIYEVAIDGSLPEDQIEYKLTMILNKVREIAIKKGVLPEPLYRRIGVISAADFYETISKIKQESKKVRLGVFAKKDIYTIGPLEIYFRILGS